MALSALMAVPAMANPTVTSPYNNDTVGSPFTLTANASTCSTQSVTSIGYSLDSNSATTPVSGTSLQKSVSAANGGHTVHVKAWGAGGAVCVTDVAITVSTSTSGSGGPDVSSPTYSSSVASPFTLNASDATCGGQAVSAMGYSIDASSSTTTSSGNVVAASVTTGTGGHTLHVKAWGKNGASCVTDVAVNVTATSASVPSSSTNVSNLQASGSWSHAHDAGTPGTSSGSTALTTSPSRSGQSLHFSTSYTNYGGERYMTRFSDDASAHNFVYDTWVYIKDTAKGVANLEMDLNQVIGNGWTVIMGFQCDGWSKTWDYTANKGSATSPDDKWVHSSQQCDPRDWALNTWHHIQIKYYRDDAGYVTYKTIALDDVTQTLNIKVFSGFALGWRKTILTNFQVDGGTKESYRSNVFVDNMNVSFW